MQFELPSVLAINFIATSIFVKCKQDEVKTEEAWLSELTAQAASGFPQVYEILCLSHF